jgi:hypothetical protein
VISGRKIVSGRGSSSISVSSTSSSQVSTPCKGGRSVNFTMVGQHPPIRLPNFRGLDDQENHLFICDKIWAENHNENDDTKVAKLEITFRYHTLDWYVGLAINNTKGTPKSVVDVKIQLINEFHKPSLEDQFMNEMRDIKHKPGESVWEADQNFKRIKVL